METIPENKEYAGDVCKLPAAARASGENIRKLSHDLSQPLMVIQGYLELFELGKCDSDADSMKKLLAGVSVQMDVLRELYGRLRSAVAPMAAGIANHEERNMD